MTKVDLKRIPSAILKRLVIGPWCWSWNGERRKQDDRPIFNRRYVYRILYEKLIGPIPANRILHHRKCNHKWCANPWHTVPITQGEHLKEHGVTGDNGGQSGKTHCPAGHAYDEDNTDGGSQGRIVFPSSNGCRRIVRIPIWKPAENFRINLDSLGSTPFRLWQYGTLDKRTPDA